MFESFFSGMPAGTDPGIAFALLSHLYPMGYCTVSEAGLILESNFTAATLLGVTHAGIINRPITQFISGEDQELYRQQQHELLETLAPREFELRMVNNLGTHFLAHLAATAQRTEPGERLLRIVLRDITEQQQTEVGRRVRDLALNSIAQGVIITDPKQSIIWANTAFASISGYSKAQILGRNCRFLQGPKTDPQMLETIRQALTSGVEFSGEILNYRKDGTEFWNDLAIAPVLNEQQQLTHFIGITRDITARKRSELAHATTTALLERTGELAKVGGWELDLRTLELVWSLETYRIHELDPTVAPNLEDAINFYAPEARASIRANVQAGIEHGTPWEIELPFITAKGRSIWVHAQGYPMMENGKAIKLLGAFQDITERKSLERALQESEQRWRSIAENPFDFVVVIDRSFRFTYVNHAAPGIDSKALIGKATPLEFADPQYHSTMRQAFETTFETGAATGYEVYSSQLDAWYSSVVGPIREQGEVTSVSILTRDITKQRKAEEQQRQLMAQLQQAQKMDSLGSLAGGVAHDMNNVLGAILSLASAHLETLPPDSPAFSAFDTISKAAIRGSEMVKSLLNFARQSPAEQRALDLNVLVREEVLFLQRTTLAKIRFELDLGPDLQLVRGDPSALTRAIMNLCVNAVDAIVENGNLTIQTRNVNKDWIEIVVADNGTGMSKAVLARALDPFFSTKAQGKGTGMGLAMVYSTVKSHRGEMTIQSEPGQGTRVKIRLPTCAPETAPETAPAAVSDKKEGDLKTPAKVLHVLLVDDDELIQRTLQAVLKVLGHTATAAWSGEQALAELDAGLKPDVVILDINMPGMGGEGTLQSIRAKHHTLPVLLSTGRVNQDALDLAEAYSNVTLLPKPFTIKDLQQQLS